MDRDTALKIEREFADAQGYTVTAQAHGVLVTEREGRTSFFTQPDNFFRFIESVAARLHPIPAR